MSLLDDEVQLKCIFWLEYVGFSMMIQFKYLDYVNYEIVINMKWYKVGYELHTFLLMTLWW